MRTRRHSGPSAGRRVVAGALVCGLFAVFGQVPVRGQDEPENGAIVGEVILPPDFEPTEPIRVVLLSEEWSRAWNGEVQTRVDNLFAANAATIDQNRSLFRLIAIRARRDATSMIVTRMQVRLGDGFADLVRDVSENNTFEFDDVAPGEYRLVAIGQSERVATVWSGTVTISGALPEFIELREPVP